MSTKLVQRTLFRGTQEFEIVDDEVHLRIKAPFRKESRVSVVLSTLSPDPVINKSSMEFHSRDGRSLQVSLLLNKPSDAEFNAFVAHLRERAEAEHNVSVGTGTASYSAGFATQIHEEPPEFDAPRVVDSTTITLKVSAARVEEVIEMLERYLDSEEVRPLLAVLEALKTEPESESYQAQLIDVFHELGPTQGAVLTYAPYLSTLLADHMFSDR